MTDELTQHYLITDDHIIALRDIQHASPTPRLQAGACRPHPSAYLVQARG